MSQLTVRKLDPELVRRLKIRAAEHNRSAEAEHRAILEAALRPTATDFWDRAAILRSGTVGRRSTESVELLRADRGRDLDTTPAKPRR